MIRKAYVTLQELKDWNACRPRYRKLLRNIEYDKSWEEVMIPLSLIHEVNGGDDVYWVLESMYRHTNEKGLRLLEISDFSKFFRVVPDSSEEKKLVSLLRRDTKTGKVFFKK